jgi:hypothetical protein
MRFEWGERKAHMNLAKHHIRFEEALRAFYDPWALYVPDPQRSHYERREKVVGEIADGIVMVVFTEVEEDLFRIISARKATPHERIEYAQRRNT